MSFEGVTKDIKDERQPMGKRDTGVKNGRGKYGVIKTSSPKGNDRSPESNVPMSNLI